MSMRENYVLYHILAKDRSRTAAASKMESYYLLLQRALSLIKNPFF